MVVKGYKHPLVQEDMWELNDVDNTSYINQHFQYHMQNELGAAQVRFQKKMKNQPVKSKSSENGFSSGLGKGVSQDALMMVRVLKEVLIILSKWILS